MVTLALQASDRVYYLFQTLADVEEVLGSSEEGQAALAAARQQLAQPAAAGANSGGADLLAEVAAALADDVNTPLAIAAFSAPLKTANDLVHTKKVGSCVIWQPPASFQTVTHGTMCQILTSCFCAKYCFCAAPCRAVVDGAQAWHNNAGSGALTWCLMLPFTGKEAGGTAANAGSFLRSAADQPRASGFMGGAAAERAC
jgi:hypothetical protein